MHTNYFRFLRYALPGFGLAALALIPSVHLTSEPEKDDIKPHKDKRYTLEDAIKKASKLCRQVKDESGSPGLLIGVSVDGKSVWQSGFGYADVENRLRCHPETVMRIASISKSITMLALAKEWEKGNLNLDVDVQTYVPQFPVKYYDNQPITITSRMLVSHLGGIRHYDKSPSPKNNEKPENTQPIKHSKPSRNAQKADEFQLKEYYIKENYSNVQNALELFQHDPLHKKPGEEFLYTTHGWTLLSAVLEGATKTPFTKYMTELFHELGMNSTYLDENTPIIYNRARYYIRNKKAKLENAQYVDNSYKWAGGGFLSTVGDLLRFGNALLYSYQFDPTYHGLPGILKPETVDLLWNPVEKTKMSWDRDGKYGMGWGVVPAQQEFGCCKRRRFYVSHTGGAVGASSVLLILPKKSEKCENDEKCAKLAKRNSIPEGIVVAMIVNLRSVSLNKTALAIAEIFDEVNS